MRRNEEAVISSEQVFAALDREHCGLMPTLS
jgi:hypothetical protein